jgi:hypothetical protein
MQIARNTGKSEQRGFTERRKQRSKGLYIWNPFKIEKKILETAAIMLFLPLIILYNRWTTCFFFLTQTWTHLWMFIIFTVDLSYYCFLKEGVDASFTLTTTTHEQAQSKRTCNTFNFNVLGVLQGFCYLLLQRLKHLFVKLLKMPIWSITKTFVENIINTIVSMILRFHGHMFKLKIIHWACLLRVRLYMSLMSYFSYRWTGINGR